MPTGQALQCTVAAAVLAHLLDWSCTLRVIVRKISGSLAGNTDEFSEKGSIKEYLEVLGSLPAILNQLGTQFNA